MFCCYFGAVVVGIFDLGLELYLYGLVRDEVNYEEFWMLGKEFGFGFEGNKEL